MTQKVKESVMQNRLSSASAFFVNEQLEDHDYLDDKMYISKTTITEAIDCTIVDQIKQHEIFIPDYIKIESLSEICNNIIKDKVKREDEVFRADDIKIESDSELLFCNNCQEIYQGYCTKCEMLVHVLNPSTFGNRFGESKGIPKDILEIKELFGHLGIFAVTVIPKNVKFGPFTGLSASGSCWRLKDGKLVVNEDKSMFLNWMQYINPARSLSEQNLLAFCCSDKLYYRSICEIQVNDELLVYFGEEYNESPNKDIEMDFIPTVEEDWKDIFACTFCCLGFSSNTYLNDHKTLCPNKTNGKFSIEELTQCAFCKIYLDKKEYFEHHMSYCRETNDSGCVPLAQNNQTIEVRRGRRRRFQMYKCTQCSYRTTYRGDLKDHANQHYEVKMYACRICKRRFKMKEYLKMHLKNAHGDVNWGEVQNWFRSEYMKKGVEPKHSNARRDELKQFECSKCDFRTKNKYYLSSHINAKHLKEFNYKCEICKYETNWKTCLEQHIKTKHLKEFKFNCELCKYETNWRTSLELHIKTKHLKEFNYKCKLCKYKTNRNYNLELHMKTKHLKEFKYNCEICKYVTNSNTDLDKHIKSKHLKELNYKCEICNYETNWKTSLKQHIKTKHLKEFNYKCEVCKYETNWKSDLEIHIKTKHLKEFNYKCEVCKYETNRKTSLKQHIRTQHLKEFSYKCEICKYETNRKTSLEQHIKSKHLKEFNYKCEVCEFQTNEKRNLEMHVKTIHLKEFNYKCEICKYKTNRKALLEQHIKTKHLKEFNYNCEICKYETNRKTSLEKHIKAKHLKECEICDFKTNIKSYSESP